MNSVAGSPDTRVEAISLALQLLPTADDWESWTHGEIYDVGPTTHESEKRAYERIASWILAFVEDGRASLACPHAPLCPFQATASSAADAVGETLDHLWSVHDARYGRGLPK